MRPRRGPIVLGLAIVLAVAVVVGDARRTHGTGHASTAPAVQRPATSTRSAAWFCPGAPPLFPTTSERVTISNVGRHGSRATVTVDPDGGGGPTRREVDVPAHAATTLRRADLGPAGPVLVETFTPDVVVTSGIETDDALASSACATRAGTEWYFAAGSTARGVSQFLVVDDPFAADAKVDVLFRTDSGVRQPDALQGYDVARRSRVVIPIHDFAVREDHVAVEVHARVGQVVAAQTLVFAADPGPAGVTMSLGVAASRQTWWFGEGTTAPGVLGWVTIANVGTLDAQVDVQAFPSSDVVLAPLAISVARDEVVWVQVGGCSGAAASDSCLPVPPDATYGVQVRSERGTTIVAQTLTRFSNKTVAVGAASSSGVSVLARAWTFGRSRVSNERATTLTLLNPSARPARVDVALMHDGDVERPRALRRIAVPAGRHIRLTLPIAVRAADAAVVVTADMPIVAEETIASTTDVTRAPGVAWSR